MTRRHDENRIAEELSAIPDLPREELISRWERAHGKLPPKGLSQRLLEYSAAYHVQATAYGGLKPTIRRKLQRHAVSKGASTTSRTAPRPSMVLSPGTRLVREWHGVTHMVEVVEKGFFYNGETYRSLSKIANVITGARWSGPRFFGL